MRIIAGVGDTVEIQSAEGAQRFGRASDSQTQPRAQDLLDVPQKFQPPFLKA